jgi:hypothetical protein
MRWCMTFWLRKAKLIQICRRALLASPFLTSLSQVGVIGACIHVCYKVTAACNAVLAVMPTMRSLQLHCMEVANYQCFKLIHGDIHGSPVDARPKVLLMQR